MTEKGWNSKTKNDGLRKPLKQTTLFHERSMSEFLRKNKTGLDQIV